jgi:hypothetical protein
VTGPLLARFRIDPLSEHEPFRPNEPNSVLHLWLEPAAALKLWRLIGQTDGRHIVKIDLLGCETTLAEDYANLRTIEVVKVGEP